MSAFGLLTREAVQDAMRRRIVFAIAAVSVLSLMVVDGCTRCSTGEIVVNGQPQQLDQVAGAAGLLTFVTLGMWIILLAGVLAADHLQQSLEDGTASLCLARPLSRASFALSRLAGVLILTGITGAVLLGATGFFLATRGALALAPAALAAGTCALGAVGIAGLSMALSLTLPRLSCILVVFGAVGSVALANGLGLATHSGGGLLAAIDHFGPPLLSAMTLALAPWVPQVQIPGALPAVLARLVIWSLIGPAALVLAFRRVELGR